MNFVWVMGAWAVLWLGSPGVLFDDGSLLLAIGALVLWGLGASRRGKKAFLLEWLAAAIGLSAICWWSTQVVWIALVGVALVPALYMACAGALLRRCHWRWPCHRPGSRSRRCAAGSNRRWASAGCVSVTTEAASPGSRAARASGA